MSDVVSSLRNPAVLHLVRLRERRHRDRSGTFLVEGVLEVERAIAAGAEVEQLVVGADHLGHADLPPGATAALAQGFLCSNSAKLLSAR